MNLTINGNHLVVTDALREYVTNKLERVIRTFDSLVEVKVLLSLDNAQQKERRQKAECLIAVKGNDLFAESVHEDLYAAIDELSDKLYRQVTRHKDKVQSHSHEAAKRLV